MKRFASLPIEWFEEHPENPNIGDVVSLRESVDEHGFRGAIEARELEPQRYQILAGAHRYRDQLARGEKFIDVIIEEFESDEAALRYLLAHNEVNRRGRYDNKRLAAALKTLPDLRGTGFDEEKLAKLELFEQTRTATKEEIEEAKDEFGREYGIILECEDEERQQELFNWLLESGIDPGTMRVVSI